MKEATGELNMTVVTLIAVAALGALFYFVVWPMVQRMVVQQTCNTYGANWVAIRQGNSASASTNTSASVGQWYCCPNKATTVTDKCIIASDANGNGSATSSGSGSGSSSGTP